MTPDSPSNPRATPILAVVPLGFPWETADPFLFCVHHDDAYPAGNERMGPAASLAGRNLGQDFEGKDGWRMYHGDVVPGFPQHPHRGFETVTIVRRGLHRPLRLAGRDRALRPRRRAVADRGPGHRPLRDVPAARARPARTRSSCSRSGSTCPSADKFAPPHFSMLWRDAVPVHASRDDQGRVTEITVVAGALRRCTRRRRRPTRGPRAATATSRSGRSAWRRTRA